MTAALGVAGWALAVLATATALLLWHERGARGEAVARACHELRGPITAVRLGLALWARAVERGPGRLDALEAELGRAALALDDLTRARAGGGLGRSGLGRGGLGRLGPRRRARGLAPHTLDQISLGPLLSEAVIAAAGGADAAGATVTGGWRGAGAIVWGDRVRLAQALGNLVSNAVEHGGGHVRVHGELRRGCARITVDDDGPGLPAPVAELARRPRAGRGERGRGLAIAVSIASAHGGSVAAAPVVRGGRVVLALPAREGHGVGSVGS